MTKFITMFRVALLIRIALVMSLCTVLSGCLGGTVIQQIARSIATSVADSAVANAMDVQELEQDRFSYYKKPEVTKNVITPQNTLQQSLVLQGSAFNAAATNSTTQNSTLLSSNVQNSTIQNLAAPATASIAQRNSALPQNTLIKQAPIDPYKLAFINAQFQNVRPDDRKPIAESLPSDFVEAETPVAVVQTSQLVPVELFNLLIGEEKAAVYTKAQLIGATSLPNKREWKLWRVATGVIKTNTKSIEKNNEQIITFLIPPDFGKLPTGSVALVEIANPGELNIARYKIN